MITLDDLEGYSIRRHPGKIFVIDGKDRFTIYRSIGPGNDVLQMGEIGPLDCLKGQYGFIWSRVSQMWKFIATDFITPEFLK